MIGWSVQVETRSYAGSRGPPPSPWANIRGLEPGITTATVSANEERRRKKGTSLKEERREAVSSLNWSQTLMEASWRDTTGCEWKYNLVYKSHFTLLL